MKPRRTPIEWCTVAKVAPTIGHLFVEGETDARALYAFLGMPHAIDVHSADDIDFDVVLSSPFVGGNKAKIFALADQHENVQFTVGNIFCLADLDFGDLFQDRKPPSLLIFTDFANLPAYNFIRDWLRAFLLKAFGAIISDHTWDSMLLCLKTAFFVRYIAALKSAGVAPDICDFLEVKADLLSLDITGYVSQYLAGTPDYVEDIVNRAHELSNCHNGDHRMYINSADMYNMLYTYLRKSKKISGSFPRTALRSAALGALVLRANGNPALQRLFDWAQKY